jgi:hypothetical protein
MRVSDFQIAIHEGGHVVASFLLLTVAGSTIEFVNGHHGLTWSDAVDLEPGTDSVESLCASLKPLMPGIGNSRIDIAVELQRAHLHVLELLAGREGERLFSGTMLPNTEHDLEEAAAIAGLICRSPASIAAYLELCRTEVAALLADHRAVVLAIADGLIRYRTINGEQITTLIANAQHNEIERE